MSDPTPRRWWVRALRVVGLSVGIVYLLLILFAVSCSNVMIFRPSGPDGAWHVTSDVEEVTLTAAGGVKTVSWFLRNTSSKWTVIFLHGNAGNLSHRIDTARQLVSLGADVLLVGYHGYGKSEGTAGEAAFYEDADVAWRYLTEQRGVATSRLVIFGESLGGAPAIDLASKRACAGLILQSAFSSIGDMSAQLLPFFPGSWFIPTKFPNLAKIGAVVPPKLVIATRSDEVVPFIQTKSLFDAARGGKTWLEFDGCGHNDLFWAHKKEWSDAIGNFLKSLS